MCPYVVVVTVVLVQVIIHVPAVVSLARVVHLENKVQLTNAQREVVVAQLVEWSLLIPEVRGSTPVIGKIYIEHLFVNLFIINCIEKTKINKKGKELPKKKTKCSEFFHCHLNSATKFWCL